jgi:DNA-binding transcriptional ArsR family regulator
MPEIEDVQYLTTLDQVHTLADPLRVRIVDRLVREPMTVKMLGTNLGEPPAKVHYHVRELERIGVIHLVETREKGGVLEKYYRALARNISIQEDLLRTSPPDELSALINDYMQLVQRGMAAALAHHRQQPTDNLPMYINGSSVWATPEEARALVDQINKLVESHQTPSGEPGEREWTLNVIGHVAVSEPEADVAKKIRRSYTVGASGYSKTDLEAVVADGYRLDLTVVGTCFIADDITPDLADRAIARLRVYGLLHARPEVRAVLDRKQSARDGRPASPSTVIRPVKTVQSVLDRKQRDTHAEK